MLYGPDEEFPVGGAKVVRSSPADQVTLIGAGVTLHNCLAAADQLGVDGVAARVVDPYSVKPVAVATLLSAAAATDGPVAAAEDHWAEGGIGSVVLAAFIDAGHPVRIRHLAVRDLPGSGAPAELMEAAGISAGQIAAAARELLLPLFRGAVTRAKGGNRCPGSSGPRGRRRSRLAGARQDNPP